uniref:COX6C domain-containing protein n=1 Tax=Heterorhabditis bacteriophora TaxID=37862 RepID=A0A1I7XPM3_HETBA
MVSPPAPMRNMLHSYGRRAIFGSLAVAFGSTLAFFFGYVQPRHEKYEEFFKNYDPYTRMKEICATNKGYMHTCPQELAKMYEEKGKEIAPL